MKKLLVTIAAIATALTVTACAGQANDPTNVTTSSATLNFQYNCAFAQQGKAWVELLHEQGENHFERISNKINIDCTDFDPNTSGYQSPLPNSTTVSINVSGLSAFSGYSYRGVVDFGADGGSDVFYTNVKHFVPGQ